MEKKTLGHADIQDLLVELSELVSDLCVDCSDEKRLPAFKALYGVLFGQALCDEYQPYLIDQIHGILNLTTASGIVERLVQEEYETEEELQSWVTEAWNSAVV